MEFIIILFLLILNGIFAMYEIALVSSSKARLETLVSKGNKSAKGVLKQLEEPEKFLSTIQIGITLIGIILFKDRSKPVNSGEVLTHIRYV